MALTVGDLTAWLRADDSGFQRGLGSARRGLGQLQRDTTGRLRDIRGRFVSEGSRSGRGLAAGISRGVGLAARAVLRLAPAVAGVGVGIPVAAAVGTALGGIAAGALAAGAGVGAFQAAVQPQLQAVADVADLAAKAEEAAAEGGEKAAAAQKAYRDALGDLPPATRETAKAFISLKAAHKNWSEGLSGDTMPVFTKGIQILRALLPTLTPFVKAAAGALRGLLGDVARGVKSAGFKQWAADMAAASGPALTNFLTTIKNFAVGFVALVSAFLPQSQSMTGGLVAMSAAFRDWATNLQGSKGFEKFLALSSEGGHTLGQLALAVGKLLIALGPLIGITTQVALALASIVNALPPSVLSALATAIAAAVIGMKAYALYARVAATASALMGSAALRAVAGWLRMAAVGTAAMIRTAVVAAASAARTAAVWALSAARMTATWLVSILRVAATTIAQFVLMAARAVAWAAIMAAQWLIAMGPIGWITIAVIALVALIIAKWDTIKAWTIKIWNWVWTKIKSIAGFIWNLFLNWTIVGRVIKHWTAIRTKTVAIWNGILNWVKRLPGRIVSFFLNWTLYGLIIRHWRRIYTGTVSQASRMLAWVRGLPGRISRAIGSLGGLLVGKGRDIVRGLARGIQSMGGWLRSKLISFAKGMIPGPIAKALGISSPSKVMAQQVGRWIPAGIVRGVQSGQGAVDRTMANLVDPAGTGVTAGTGGLGTAAGGGAQTVRVVLDVTGGDSELKRMLRKMVRIDGRGSVQTAFGTG